MQRAHRDTFVLTGLIGLLALASAGVARASSSSDEPLQAVAALFQTITGELDDPADRRAMEQLQRTLVERGALTAAQERAWILLTFDRTGALAHVAVNADRLLAKPPLIQRAVILHELEHLKWAHVTRRTLETLAVQRAALGDPLSPAQRTAAADILQATIRTLIEDEARAYRRDLLYVEGLVRSAGGLHAYLARLPSADRALVEAYYEEYVQRLVRADGTLDDIRLRRDLIFFGTFPHRHRRYYEAALAWEALQGHAELRRDHHGTLRLTRLIAPVAFLSWLVR